MKKFYIILIALFIVSGTSSQSCLQYGITFSSQAEIDTREVTDIPVDARRCEIITGQDPSSYTLVYANEKVSSIKITDPSKFWGKTNYLVVVVRESNFDETAYSR